MLSIASAFSCSSDDDTPKDEDKEKPEIVDGKVPNPIDCQQYRRGETIPFRYTFTDNVELGSFNIEIHNNFDHHTHSTEAGDCELDPIKDPVTPWIYNKDFEIPASSKRFEAKQDFKIPENIDCGDYHFMIRVTDAAGWQQIKSVSIKIIDE
ncbi:MAG TPA: hypothetical protein DC009_09180 [Porphyromonadaceae bacterium]|nr:hypothetical protein [Porphyromonadaceae bacterium]